MICTPYRPKRIKNGKSVAGRMYRGRIRLKPGDKIIDIALHTNDKQTAFKILAEKVKELHQEQAGFIAPRQEREANQTPILKHLEDFLAARDTEGCVPKYTRGLEKQLLRLFKECAWKSLSEITCDSFERWRSRCPVSPNTLNKYLGAATSFLNWLNHCGRIPRNPLSKTRPVEIRGKQIRVRRALSEAEIRALISVSGKRRPVYLAAIFTGLRRGELLALQWRDVRQSEQGNFLGVRAGTTKSKNRVNIPLHSNVTVSLAEMRPVNATAAI